MMILILQTVDDKELISSKGSYYNKKRDGFVSKKFSPLAHPHGDIFNAYLIEFFRSIKQRQIESIIRKTAQDCLSDSSTSVIVHFVQHIPWPSGTYPQQWHLLWTPHESGVQSLQKQQQFRQSQIVPYVVPVYEGTTSPLWHTGQLPLGFLILPSQSSNMIFL